MSYQDQTHSGSNGNEIDQDELLDRLADLMFDMWNNDVKEYESQNKELHN